MATPYLKSIVDSLSRGAHSKDIPILPTQIDVFVHSEFEADGYALGYASNLPKEIKVHLIDWNEMNPPIEKNADGTDKRDENQNLIWLSDPCVMNLNKCSDLLQVVKQRAIWINKNSQTTGTYTDENGEIGRIPFGMVDPVVGAPHQVRAVQVFYDLIKNTRDRAIAAMALIEPGKTLQVDALEKVVKRTIGHEIGHAIGLYHPWQDEDTGRERGTQQSLTITTCANYYS